MNKSKTTKTVYLAVEVVTKNSGKASLKTIEMLKHLYKEGLIENYEVFVVDDNPINDTKKFISSVLFEVMKIKTFSDKAFLVFNSYIKLFNDIVKHSNLKP